MCQVCRSAKCAEVPSVPKCQVCQNINLPSDCGHNSSKPLSFQNVVTVKSRALHATKRRNTKMCQLYPSRPYTLHRTNTQVRRFDPKRCIVHRKNLYPTRNVNYKCAVYCINTHFAPSYVSNCNPNGYPAKYYHLVSCARIAHRVPLPIESLSQYL